MTQTPSSPDWITFGNHLRVNIPDAKTACDVVAARLEPGNGCTMATLNLDHAVHLRKPGPFQDAYAQHSLITADGHPIAWLARQKGKPVVRVTGADLVLPFVEIAVRLDLPIGLVGAKLPVLEGAATGMHTTCPEARIDLKIAPSYPFEPHSPEADAIIDDLHKAGIRLCFLALGAPRQEILATRIAEKSPEIGVISVGAGIDFIAGNATRAPAFFQHARLEWFWRLIQEPGRLGPRYWECAKILPRLFLESRQHS